MNPILLVEEVVGKMDSEPRFIAADWSEVASELSTLMYDKTQDGTKYPLIVMSPIFTETRGGTYSEFTTSFYFITATNKNYTTKQRLELVFDDILEPLFAEFLYTMFREGVFTFDKNPVQNNEVRIDHTREYLFLPPNELNDIIDCLKINLTLKK